MELLKSNKGISRKSIFLLGALGLIFTVLLSSPKTVNIINVGNININKEE